MENLNEKNETTKDVDLSKYKKMFENLQTNPDKKKRPTREEILAKYFVPRNSKETFRVLPPLKGKDFIETAFFHVIPVNAAGGKKKYRKIYCPAHNDPKVPKLDKNGQVIKDQQGNPVMVTKHCPLCEKSKKILSKQDQSIRRIKKEDMNPQQLAIKEENDKIYKSSLDWQAKKFYIIRGVDKGAEKDGVKFWRFKHNYRQQGILDKLGPAITSWMELNQVDFTDPYKGTDLILTVVDQEFPGKQGRTYRDVSSIFPKGSSKLHEDPIVVKEWLNDETTWRDVFKPPTAKGITPDEYLEMVAINQAPYWDDSDQNDKKWVFPGRPDLEAAANTRNQDLDADNREEKIEMASDIVGKSYDNVSIENVTKEDVGEFKDDAVDLTAEVKQSESTDNSDDKEEDVDINDDEIEDYEDLPF